MKVEISIHPATEGDAGEIALLRNAAAEHLTREHGRGHWSGMVTEKGTAWAVRTSSVLLARLPGGSLAATLRLATKKPWAIDRQYFTAVPRPLYLVDMAVRPDMQRRGLGRRLVEEAKAAAVAWPAQAIWLDAYDAAAGAGPFYAKCGFREVGRAAYRGVPLIYYEWTAG